MSERSYTKAVEKELIQAAQTAAVRESEKRIKDIADIAARWKKGRLAADAALESIRQTANAPAASWLWRKCKAAGSGRQPCWQSGQQGQSLGPGPVRKYRPAVQIP